MRIKGKDSVCHKLAYEVRFAQGLIYLDRCGTTCNRITANYPDWVIQENAINPQNAPLINVTTGTHFNFGTEKFSFTLDQPIKEEVALTQQDIKSFVNDTESLSIIVQEELELRRFTREGFRIWYLFPAETPEEAQEWISQLGAFNVNTRIPESLGGTLQAEGHTVIIRTNERMFRISVNAAEREASLDIGSNVLKILPRNLPKGQKKAVLERLKAKGRLLANPHHAVMIDVDAYVDEPISVTAGDFISQSLEIINKTLPHALQGD